MKHDETWGLPETNHVKSLVLQLSLDSTGHLGHTCRGGTDLQGLHCSRIQTIGDWESYDEKSGGKGLRNTQILRILRA